MTALASEIDRRSARFVRNREGMLERLRELDAQLEAARAGGGERYVERHRGRGRLLPRERIELLVDRDSAFLELSPVAAHGSQFTTGAALVTGIGCVEEVECVIVAHDPTVRGGALNPFTFRKAFRAMEIAERCRLPLISLVESGGGDLETQADIFVPGGEWFRRESELSAQRIPVISVVFGNATAGGAYTPGVSDYNIFVSGHSKVFLGGPPLVKMATGEDADDEALGGAEMHARTSGLADYLALDEPDALRLCRQVVRRLNWRKLGPGASVLPVREPLHPIDDLVGIPSIDLREPYEMREVIARIVDGSDYDEFKPLYGEQLTTGFAAIHGYPIGIIANDRGVLFSQESHKATQFIQLCNQISVPLLFIHNVTGYMVGTEYEQKGIIKHGSQMIHAVTGSRVPHLVVIAGGSYGAGNFGMSGRSYRPHFLFAWPNAKVALMGPQQLAGVLSIVSRAAAQASGRQFDEEADAVRNGRISSQVEAESLALPMSGRLYDDGVIDPRDTRTVLGIALSACHSNVIEGARGYAVFRM
jgi:acyl-CoA carboxylase subunit beta